MDNFWSATLALWIGGLITSILMATLGYFSIISIYKFRALKRVKRWK
jgi:hypothetical protein